LARGRGRNHHRRLNATNLEPEFILPSDGEAAFGGFRIWLPITNMGHTPAFDLEITARIEVMNQGVEQVSLPEKRAGQTLIPRDVLHHEIGTVFLGGPDTSIRVYVEIVYRTIDGGRAHVRVGFVYAVRQGWHNLPTRYRFWLADGTLFPGRYPAEHSDKRGIVALKPETKEFPSP
jgi:hypothetical protein